MSFLKALFLTGHGPVPVCGPGFGDPCSRECPVLVTPCYAETCFLLKGVRLSCELSGGYKIWMLNCRGTNTDMGAEGRPGGEVQDL